MKRLLILSGLCVAALIAAASGAQAGPLEEKPKEPYKPSQPQEMVTDMILDMYAKGDMKASYWVQIHDKPAAGQYWVTKSTSDYGGYKHETMAAWQVVKVEGDVATIENDSGQGYVTAYQVNTKTKIEDGANVTKAWVGKAGGTATEVKVMEWIKPGQPVEGEEQPKYETTTTEATLKIAGKEWACTQTVVKMDAITNTSWTSKDGWFGGMLKMEYKMEGGGGAIVLEQFGDDGKAWLKWEDAAKAGDKPEEKKPQEAKPEEKKPEGK